MTYQPAMAPPPRKSNTTKIVLIVVGVVLVLCCGGGAAGGFAIYQVAKNATAPVRSSVETYADGLVAHDYATAYGQLCRSVRARVSEDEFIRQQSGRPAVTGYRIVGVRINTTNGQTRGSASVRYTPEHGTAQTQEYHLVKEDGNWRICD